MTRMQDEIGKPGSSGMLALCGWLMRYALSHRRGLIGVIATMLLKTVLDLLKPWPMKVLVDHALNNKPRPRWMVNVLDQFPGVVDSQHLVAWCVAATVVMFLLAWTLGVATAVSHLGFGQRLSYGLASDVFMHLQQLSLRFHGRKSVGDLIRRVTTDCACVSTIVKDALLPALTSVILLFSMFFVLWQINWQLTLISLAVVPFMFAVFHRYSEPMVQVSYKQEEADGRMYTLVEQTLSAIPVVQAFSREESVDREFRGTADQSLAAAVTSTRVQLQFKILMGLSTAVGTALILFIGGHQVLADKITVGSLLVFVSYLASLYAPLESLAYTSSTIQGAAGSARRVLEVLQSEPDVRDAPHPIVLTEVQGDVEFENVTFGYEENRPVLESVTLRARPGEVIAVVGRTGAGKSTLAALISRLFDPWQGRILLDGRDVRELKLVQLRENIALVLQDPFLFPASVSANIAYGRPDATPEQIEAAARAANAHEFIERLPNGYNTIVGERGATLSVGQRQRVSIARALLKDAPVLVLDEPTSALDAITERLLLEALDRLMAGRTTFVIAHRLSTIRHADSIVVLEDGRILERGTHEELLAAEGFYATLWRSPNAFSVLEART